MTENYPALHQLFGAYFHQDWMLDDGSPDSVIQRFIRENPHALVQSVQRELARLLDRADSEAELATNVAALGCEYDPTADHITYRDWLTELNARLLMSAPS